MHNKLVCLVDRCNPIKLVFNQVFEQKHTHVHRITAGSVLIMVGVAIAKASHGVELAVLQYALDGVGYLVHGIGAVPIVDWLLSTYSAEE